MTDTTDIKALRKRLQSAISQHEMMMGCVMGLGKVDPMYQQCIDALDQLEAERQRADKAQADMQFECDAHIDTAESWREWKLRAITAEAEVAELRAKLANPVVLPNVTTERSDWTTLQWIEHLGGRFQHGNPGDYIEFGSVYAVQQMLKQFGRTMVAQTIPLCADAIKEAGFTVKGGE